MFSKAEEIIKICNDRNIAIYELVLEEELKTSKMTKEEIRAELGKMFEVMEGSASAYLEEPRVTHMGMIDGFAHKMYEYSKRDDTITGSFLVETMAMAFSTLELSSTMGKIVASPTAGSSGILPAALLSLKRKNGYTTDQIVNAMLTAIGLAKIIGRYGSFAGAEGGCQAETGSAASMAAGAVTYLYGGTPEQSFHAGAIAFVNVLGLVCDPIAGLVEYPCTFRNASGVMNAFLSADMALAGVKSVVPYDEVCQAVGEVGAGLPFSLRESGLGGLAGTNTGRKIREEFLGSNS